MKVSGSLWILWVLLVVSSPSLLRVSCGPSCMLCTCGFTLHYIHAMHLESALVQWFFFSQQKSLLINFPPAFIIHNYGL